MVVFTCNSCGESLRKPAVEKHYNFCRSAKNLTCVDCFKDFRGEEYVTHTKCITEEERYAKKGSMPNGIVKKGEVKQESWVEMIKSILEQSNLKPSHRNLLNTICTYSNIPRKKPKFLNFIKSSSGGRVNMREVEEVWNIIESYKAKKATNQNNTQPTKSSQDITPEVNKRKISEDIPNENTKDEVPKKKKKKEKLADTTENGDSNKNTEDGESKKKKKKEKLNGVGVENGDSNENTEHEGAKKKKKKDKLSTQVENDNTVQETSQVEEETGNESFNYTTKILDILAKKGTITLEKLQKKVINAYLKHSGESETSPKIIKKFNKKLKKIDSIEIINDQVSLKVNS
ncbi:cell growth-regulating nucleolar protein [Diabrotica virgifera virgifera]|uniref:Cell growth-regulating nucleolar protein n=1 Tax=Diabrotica virgifera virgifera TaxID=50390 RepID=A0ABM5IZ38_DIAVI|nr:cell growth-regulating nucleolar protein [Diabrotica virgifera virgifera]